MQRSEIETEVGDSEESETKLETSGPSIRPQYQSALGGGARPEISPAAAIQQPVPALSVTIEYA